MCPKVVYKVLTTFLHVSLCGVILLKVGLNVVGPIVCRVLATRCHANLWEIASLGCWP